MRASVTLALIGLLAVALVASGCGNRSAEQPVVPAAADAGNPAPADGKVNVHAYINVSSGCQADTVDLLNSLAAEYGDYISYTLTDFGSSEGAREWIAAGLDCMTILFDGRPAVALDSPAGAQIIIFELPVGLGLWNHDDLRMVMEAIRAGTFRTATEQEVADYLAPTRVPLKVSVQKVEDTASGQVVGQVVADGQVLMVFQHPHAGRTPLQRAEAATKALNEWLANPILPSDIAIEELDEGFALLVTDRQVAIATPKDVGDPDLPTRRLAAAWAGAISHAVMVARAEQKKAEQAAPAVPPATQ